jgi:hypothetical protein
MPAPVHAGEPPDRPVPPGEPLPDPVKEPVVTPPIEEPDTGPDDPKPPKQI